MTNHYALFCENDITMVFTDKGDIATLKVTTDNSLLKPVLELLDLDINDGEITPELLTLIQDIKNDDLDAVNQEYPFKVLGIHKFAA